MGTHLMIPKLQFYLLIISIIFSFAFSDMAQDKKECDEVLRGMVACFAYVTGGQKAPTPNCCNALKKVLEIKEKCLCLILKYGPKLGLGINVTLALGLPSVCHAQADVSKCPALLHLNPKSPEAQIFKQFGPTSNSTAKSPISSPSPSGGSSASGNGEVKSRRIWMGLQLILGGLLFGITTLKI